MDELICKNVEQVFVLNKSSTEVAADLAKQSANEALNKRINFICRNRLGFKKIEACKRSNSILQNLEDFGDIDDLHHTTLLKRQNSQQLHRGKINCQLGDVMLKRIVQDFNVSDT